MICPKCKEGTINKIEFVQTKETAYLCNTCEALWFKKDEISEFNASHLHTFFEEREKEYTVKKLDIKDWEHEELTDITSRNTSHV